MGIIKMDVGERIVAGQILPKEGSFVTLRLVRDLSEKIGISADEHKKFGVKIDQKNGHISWNKEGTKKKDIDFKTKEIEVLSKVLEELDKKEKLEQKHFSIYNMFVMDEEEDKDGES